MGVPEGIADDAAGRLIHTGPSVEGAPGSCCLEIASCTGSMFLFGTYRLHPVRRSAVLLAVLVTHTQSFSVSGSGRVGEKER